MSNDEWFKKIVADWLPAIRDSSRDDGLERMLFMFAKEVSRETRHKASDIAQAASRDIMNMQISNR